MHSNADLWDIGDGVYSAEYFNRARRILAHEEASNGRDILCTMQFFQKTPGAMLFGINEVVDLFTALGLSDSCIMRYLPSGTMLDSRQVAMEVTGPYGAFAHMESIFLGILARGTRVASNMRDVVGAARGKEVIFMGDRFDRYENQASDGVAVLAAGATDVCTPIMAMGSGRFAKGTMSHSLIALCGGDVVEACHLFQEYYPGVPLVALVDFHNNCVGDAIHCLQLFGKDLQAVRLDTSENVVDSSLLDSTEWWKAQKGGVTPQLVRNVRLALDTWDGQHVRIIVSGGFTPTRITEFEKEGVPVDVYGVGSSILSANAGKYDFTADVVCPCAKIGRQYREMTGNVQEIGRIKPRKEN